ncbi:MAG: hypothetical protein Kow0077_07320 [Anaerolineae bacterium]
MKKSEVLIRLARRLGGATLLDRFWGHERLTVLAHHRVTPDVLHPDFPYYQPNVSATPEMFEAQLAYIASHYHVIGLEDLRQFVAHGASLPPRPLLITFDDGFRDNYDYAFPVLKRYGFPAVLFLMTSRMDEPVLAWWDACAYCFFHTDRGRADLPLLGETDLSTPVLKLAARERLMKHMKRVSEAEKLAALEQLPEALGVPEPPRVPEMFVTWDQVREMDSNGVVCMPHTMTHPILTRVDTDQQRSEITGSAARVREVTGREMVAFAYPNGTIDDYNETTLQALRSAGIELAFTLTPGPARPAEVRQHPLEIQRVFLSYKDSLDRFIFKLLGLPRFQEPPRFLT